MVLLYCLLVGISGIMIMRRRLAQFFENCSSFFCRYLRLAVEVENF